MHDARVRWIDVAWSPAEVTHASGAEQDVTVPGVNVDDVVLTVHKPAAFDTGVGICGYRVKAVNTISVMWLNDKASGEVTPASGTYTFVVMAKQPGGR